MSGARIRYLSCLPGLLLAGTVAAQAAPARGVDVAVFAIEAGASADAQLTRLAHQLTARLIGALQSQKLSVGRARASDTVTARVSVHGSLTGEAGAYTAELRLLQGGAGEELRSYMFGPGDVKGVLGLADRAAPRIAAAVSELDPSAR